MKKERSKHTFGNELRVFRNVKVMVCAALLASLSIVLGKFLQIPNPIQNVVRISFENLPIIMSGVFFGPTVGIVTGALADLVGCLVYGYEINFLITLGAASVGAISGIIAKYLIKNPLWLKLILTEACAHIVGSVVIKTFGLAAWYDMPIPELMLWRLITYTIIGVAEFTIIYILLRNKGFSSQLERMLR